MKRPLVFLFLVCYLNSFSQQKSTFAIKWVDSVMATLTEDQKIAQLMTLRLSSTDGKRVTFYDSQVREAIQKYNIGGVTLFQGAPVQQATIVNELQQMSKTPLLISIDGETGIGMRMDSVLALPKQMTLGAITDPSVIYEYGRIVGEQCKRMGIQVNYAPVVDINNNMNNPVINDRSFGEDKHKVALYGMQYMRGMQDVGVMACAKHFPGHGDVSVDSHFDLPVISKSRAVLDSMELYPFRQMVNAGVGAVMVAHLAVPSIEPNQKLPTSISPAAVNSLLRKELGFEGLIVTDALEMKGVSKFYSPAELSLKSLEAGNDMLCLPGDIPGSIKLIKEAIRKKDITWAEIDQHVRRVLHAKYQYGLAVWKPVSLEGLTEDLNAKTLDMKRLIAEKSITLLRNDDPAVFPLSRGKRVAYIGIGLNRDNTFARQMRDDYDAHVYYFDYNMKNEMVAPMVELLNKRYDVVILGVHRYSRFPGNNFGMSDAAASLIQQVQATNPTITMVFGNPYIIKNLCNTRVLLACYEDDEITQQTAADLLHGRFTAKGKLPVTVCESFKVNDGIVANTLLPQLRPADLGFNIIKLTSIDSIVNDAIQRRAIPGAVVLVAKDGKIAYQRAYGFMGYDSTEPVYPETIYDLASVTKILATTLAVMRLYDEGKIDLKKNVGDYLAWTKGSNKEKLPLWNILLHQAGLKGWIPFYRETLDPKSFNGPSYAIYRTLADADHPVRVAENVYIRKDWRDTLYKRILESAVAPQGIYLYSDLDFIFLGNIVEQVTGMSLDQYVKKTFYEPLGLTSISFLPRKYFPIDNIAPTEAELIFRKQLLRGDVHDPGAAMFGGVAGHAGLFGTAYDVAVLCQMLLNGGSMKGIRFFKEQTVKLFTSYHSSVSRRGLGFDKPEKDNARRQEAYPTASASPETWGHTGFTGTCIWVDPACNLIYVFLSNRVYNNGDPNRFNRLNVRPKVHEMIYQSLKTG